MHDLYIFIAHYHIGIFSRNTVKKANFSLKKFFLISFIKSATNEFCFSMIKFEHKKFIGKLWVKIFYHNINSGFYSKNYYDFLYSEGENNFSIIGQIMDLYKYNRVFEFVLDYGSNGFIAWQQKANPLNVFKVNSTASSIGLRIISNRNDWKGFNGLMRSNSSGSHLDCQSKTHEYWYSIGTKGYAKTKIPGPLSPGGIEVDEVTLWLRIPPVACSVCSFHKSFLQRYCFLANLLLS